MESEHCGYRPAMCFWLPKTGIGLSLLAISSFGFGTGPKQDSGDSESLQKLANLATRLQDRREHGDQLLTEAVKLCGFQVEPDAFFTTSHASLASPSPASGPNNNLYVSESEMREFSDLFHAGQWTNLSDLVNSIDKLGHSIGMTTSCKDSVYRWLRDGQSSKNTETRLLTAFIHDLANSHSNVRDLTISDATSLDAIQTFLVLRVMTEELEVPLRKRARRSVTAVRASHSFPIESWDLLPEGFATNSYVVSIAGYLPKVEAYVEGLEEGRITGALAKLNPILAVVKVVASYACLKGDIDMEAPGAPLIRTKSWHTDDAGEKRTLTAHFYYDKDKVQDFMNSNQAYFNALGIQPDMPKGDLAGVETAWDFRTPVLATQQTFRTVTGQGDINKVVTDEGGIAKVTIEGTPQFQAISDDFATPVDKRYQVFVTPQLVKPTADTGFQLGMSAFTAIRSGGEGTFGVLTDFMAGMKIKTGTQYSLVVRDWTNAKAVADLSLEYNAVGSNGAIRQRIFHFFNIENALVFEIPKPKIQTTLTAEQLKYIPESERAKVVAALAGVHVDDGWISFGPDSKNTSTAHWGMMDELSGGTVEQTWNGGGDINLFRSMSTAKISGFTIGINVDKKIGTIIAAASGDVTWTRHSIGADHSTDSVTTIVGDTAQRVEIDSDEYTDGKWTFPVTITGEGASTVYSADLSVKINSSERFPGTLRIKFKVRKAGK